VCPHCGERAEIFGTGGGLLVAERFGIAFLGQVPLDLSIRVGGGEGQPLMAAMPDSPVGEVFRAVASHIAAEVSKENYRVGATGPVMPSGPRIRLG
jgi:ATP-binding protein involved in chromosome partitioning